MSSISALTWWSVISIEGANRVLENPNKLTDSIRRSRLEMTLNDRCGDFSERSKNFEAGLKRGVGRTRRDSRLNREMVESWKKKMTRGQDFNSGLGGDVL